MANVFVDSTLLTGLNDGTTWADAYRSIETAMNGSNVAAGDDVWWMNQETSGSLVIIDGPSDKTNPARLHGVKSATTAEPPAQSDLIPGWRTGETRTLANRAYKDTDSPQAETTGTVDVRLRGYVYAYGCRFVTDVDFDPDSALDEGWECEECLFEITRVGSANWHVAAASVSRNKFKYINCGFETNNASNRIQCENSNCELYGLEMIATVVPTVFLSGGSRPTGHLRFIGSDFTGLSTTLINLASVGASEIIFKNCSLHASVALTTGTPNGRYRLEFHGCSSVTGKSSGSILDLDISTNAGDMLEETTAVRTGGANDGAAGAHSWAMTPNVNDTRDNYYSLESSWITGWIEGDGTSKTLTIFIANSGAADYNDDDVWLEAMYPSDAGTSQHTQLTNQMDLLGTPTAVTDDTGSTWGTGGNNHQKLQLTIAPDYEGAIYCRVHFAKNFSSSPETLYVDPKLDIA